MDAPHHAPPLPAAAAAAGQADSNLNLHNNAHQLNQFCPPHDAAAAIARRSYDHLECEQRSPGRDQYQPPINQHHLVIGEPLQAIQLQVSNQDLDNYYHSNALLDIHQLNHHHLQQQQQQQQFYQQQQQHNQNAAFVQPLEAYAFYQVVPSAAAAAAAAYQQQQHQHQFHPHSNQQQQQTHSIDQQQQQQTHFVYQDQQSVELTTGYNPVNNFHCLQSAASFARQQQYGQQQQQQQQQQHQLYQAAAGLPEAPQVAQPFHAEHAAALEPAQHRRPPSETGRGGAPACAPSTKTTHSSWPGATEGGESQARQPPARVQAEARRWSGPEAVGPAAGARNGPPAPASRPTPAKPAMALKSPRPSHRAATAGAVTTVPLKGRHGIVNGMVARRKNATRQTTAMLKDWLDEHGANPYPTKGEKIMLSIITKMSLTQVSTWFANARRRMKKENKAQGSWVPAANQVRSSTAPNLASLKPVGVAPPAAAAAAAKTASPPSPLRPRVLEAKVDLMTVDQMTMAVAGASSRELPLQGDPAKLESAGSIRATS